MRRADFGERSQCGRGEDCVFLKLNCLCVNKAAAMATSVRGRCVQAARFPGAASGVFPFAAHGSFCRASWVSQLFTHVCTCLELLGAVSSAGFLHGPASLLMEPRSLGIVIPLAAGPADVGENLFPPLSSRLALMELRWCLCLKYPSTGVVPSLCMVLEVACSVGSKRLGTK